MSKKLNGQDFLSKDDFEFIDDDGSSSIRYSDGSGSYNGTDGSYGTRFSDGVASIPVPMAATALDIPTGAVSLLTPKVTPRALIKTMMTNIDLKVPEMQSLISQTQSLVSCPHFLIVMMKMTTIMKTTTITTRMMTRTRMRTRRAIKIYRIA